MTHDPLDNRRAFALFAINLVLWGYNWVPLHYMLQDAGPATASFIRMFGGALTLFTLLIIRGQSLKPPRERPYIWIGLTQVGANSALTSLGLLYGGVSRSTILLFTMPFWAMLLARIFLHEKISATRWIALAIALSGVGMIAFTGQHDRAQLLGALCSIGAGLFWAIGTTIALRSSPRDLMRSVAWEQLTGSLPLLALVFLFDEAAPNMSGRFIACSLFAGIIASGLGWVMWNRSAQLMSAATLSLGAMSIPIIATLAAYVQLGERPSGLTLVGLATIVAALALASLSGIRRQRASGEGRPSTAKAGEPAP